MGRITTRNQGNNTQSINQPQHTAQYTKFHIF